ncbi:MAG: galactose-1-phosphate uridylyltransferase [Actinomycetota bacterium]
MIAHQTPIRLSDGRELIYFDATEGLDRTAVDRRGLEPTSVFSEMRLDPVTDEWVVIASHRQGRTHLPTTADCPLCPTTDGNLTEIPAAEYDVVVFENRFSSLSQQVPDVEPFVGGDALYRRRPGVGRCEVVCFSDDHDASFVDLKPDRVRLIVDAWADRTDALSALSGVEQVFPFENRGEEIGVTLRHPHGQIYGYPFVTPRTERMLASARRHRERTGGNLFVDILRAEQAAGERIVARNEHWTAFVPAAPRWPVEIHLYPNRRVLDLRELDEAQRDDFATLYLDVLARMDALYGVPMPYISAWHQAPVLTGHDDAYLHLQLFSVRRAVDKLKYLAGSESGMGVFVNDIIPERMAARLRESRR